MIKFPINAWLATHPDKVFVWNPDGQYLGYLYAKPQTRHYVGAGKIIGQYIQDVLPPEIADQVFSVMRVAWLGHQMQICTIHLPLEGLIHKVCIRFYPQDHSIIGLVNDYKLPTTSLSTPSY